MSATALTPRESRSSAEVLGAMFSKVDAQPPGRPYRRRRWAACGPLLAGGHTVLGIQGQPDVRSAAQRCRPTASEQAV